MLAEVFLTESKSSDGDQTHPGVIYNPLQGVLFFPCFPTGTGTSEGTWGMGAGIATANENFSIFQEFDTATATGSGRYRSDRCMIASNANTVLSDALLANFNNGYTLTFDHTNNPTYSYIQFPMTGLTNLKAIAFNTPGATGDVDYTGFGFQPDGCLLFGVNTSSADVTTNCGFYMGFCGSDLTQMSVATKLAITAGSLASGNKIGSNVRILTAATNAGATSVRHAATVASFLADGVRFNYTTSADTAYRFVLVAWKGVESTCVETTVASGATGAMSVTTGWRPNAALFCHIDSTTSSSNDEDIGVGAIGASGTQAAAFSTNVQSTANADSVRSNAHFWLVCNSSGTVIRSAEWTGWNATGMDFNVDVNAGAARVFYGLYFKEPTPNKLSLLGVG